MKRDEIEIEIGICLCGSRLLPDRERGLKQTITPVKMSYQGISPILSCDLDRSVCSPKFLCIWVSEHYSSKHPLMKPKSASSPLILLLGDLYRSSPFLETLIAFPSCSCLIYHHHRHHHRWLKFSWIYRYQEIGTKILDTSATVVQWLDFDASPTWPHGDFMPMVVPVTNMQLCETGMAQPIPVGALASALPV
ncbi:hypothetical protein L2E82_44655 [Cichorium intybus]|uniref:Uncharacterized protein n=1 Tax=Cichorium intybus TaxID=13427 RepID=A0ACB8ZQP6_CICIN|nr:hypothetical protein L2E82_44655 [Cichorium intybus]